MLVSSYLVCFLFPNFLVLEPISFDLSPKLPTDNLLQSLGQEAICRSETNWDLGLGEFTWIHLGFPSLFSPHALNFIEIY